MYSSQLFGWSKHPRSFGVRGYLGNHVSISENADIHETIYETKKSAIGGYMIYIFSPIVLARVLL